MSAEPPSKNARRARQIVIDLSVLAGIGIVLGLLAPLGSGAMPLAGRIAYWVVLAMTGYLFYKPIGDIVLRLGPRLDLPDWFLWTGSVLIASIPMAIVVWLVDGLRGTLRVPSLEAALVHYAMVGVVGAVITLMFNLLPATGDTVVQRAPEAPPAPEPVATTEPSPAPRFLDRLPPALGSDLVALEMEDHYVRAHTALGSELVLLRMRDAVAELDGIDGEQVHRSWWVARGAVRDVKREGRNVRLVQDNGIEAPVSRANVTPLKDAGWF